MTQSEEPTPDALAAQEDAVMATNQAFYDAFEASDMVAMASVWEHSDRVICTHPGWATLRGWTPVQASFAAILSNPAGMQFILTNQHVVVQGSAAWVTLDENLLQSQGSGTVACVNWFALDDDGTWKMVGHHGSSVVTNNSQHFS